MYIKERKAPKINTKEGFKFKPKYLSKFTIKLERNFNMISFILYC